VILISFGRFVPSDVESIAPTVKHNMVFLDFCEATLLAIAAKKVQA
jgi:hypothetical protein